MNEQVGTCNATLRYKYIWKCFWKLNLTCETSFDCGIMDLFRWFIDTTIDSISPCGHNQFSHAGGWLACAQVSAKIGFLHAGRAIVCKNSMRTLKPSDYYKEKIAKKNQKSKTYPETLTLESSLHHHRHRHHPCPPVAAAAVIVVVFVLPSPSLSSSSLSSHHRRRRRCCCPRPLVTAYSGCAREGGGIHTGGIGGVGSNPTIATTDGSMRIRWSGGQILAGGRGGAGSTPPVTAASGIPLSHTRRRRSHPNLPSPEPKSAVLARARCHHRNASLPQGCQEVWTGKSGERNGRVEQGVWGVDRGGDYGRGIFSHGVLELCMGDWFLQAEVVMVCLQPKGDLV